MAENATPEPAQTPESTQPAPDAGRSVVRPDPRSLRALAHPLRLQLLGLLRSDGPATATQLAERTGQTSGATSYHLRQLAAYGFVAEDAERGNARDRWWRAAHRTTEFDLPPDATEEDKALGEQYLRVVADASFRRLDAAIAGLATLDADLGAGWDRGFTMSDYNFRLTKDEAVRLVAELEAVAGKYRREAPEQIPDAPDGAERVWLQFQVMPDAGGRMPSARDERTHDDDEGEDRS
jgi:DNA-binding transcriptional ArsR family regulator